ncbi:transposase [Paraburkholderia sp. CI3]|uniref:transposase n=1 Tax=Paraburkholderia sp. CI3 TaxID=2991060 RepID=UPI003D1FB504
MRPLLMGGLDVNPIRFDIDSFPSQSNFFFSDPELAQIGRLLTMADSVSVGPARLNDSTRGQPDTKRSSPATPTTSDLNFQQHGSRCRMWVAPEVRDPVLMHAPTRKSVACLGAVSLSTGRFVWRARPVFNAETFVSFLRQLLRHRRRGKRIVVVLDNAKYHHAILLKPLLRKYTRQLSRLVMPEPCMTANSPAASERKRLLRVRGPWVLRADLPFPFISATQTTNSFSQDEKSVK